MGKWIIIYWNNYMKDIAIRNNQRETEEFIDTIKHDYSYDVYKGERVGGTHRWG